MTARPAGVVLYDGPSVLDDEPILAIATFRTKNRKTGGMIQTWIIRKDISPLDAAKSGADRSVCGVCPLRHYLNGHCYVVIAQAPQRVWHAFHRGAYPEFAEGLHSRYFIRRSLRVGSYGDPAAVPYEIWVRALDLATSYTGYTHQISHHRFDRRIASFCMVSADTATQAERFQARGHSTFRIRSANANLLENEVICRNEVDGTTCERCGLCTGSGSANVVTVKHGKFGR